MMHRTILALAFVALAPTAPLQAKPGNEQGEVRKEMRAGNVRSLREIESRVLPTMRGAEYLGPYYDAVAMAYRLKFIRRGHVVFVDVDARSGAIIDQSQ